MTLASVHPARLKYPPKTRPMTAPDTADKTATMSTPPGGRAGGDSGCGARFEAESLCSDLKLRFLNGGSNGTNAIRPAVGGTLLKQTLTI